MKPGDIVKLKSSFLSYKLQDFSMDKTNPFLLPSPDQSHENKQFFMEDIGFVLKIFNKHSEVYVELYTSRGIHGCSKSHILEVIQ